MTHMLLSQAERPYMKNALFIPSTEEHDLFIAGFDAARTVLFSVKNLDEFPDQVEMCLTALRFDFQELDTFFSSRLRAADAVDYANRLGCARKHFDLLEQNVSIGSYRMDRRGCAVAIAYLRAERQDLRLIKNRMEFETSSIEGS